MRRLARTELLPVQVGATSVTGRALIGNRTAASIAWTIRGRGGGATEATLCATVEQAGPLDRLLLRIGGSRWLARRFAAALAHLSDELVSPNKGSAGRAGTGSPAGSVAEPVRQSAKAAPSARVA
jgi:hypothetical protein